MKTLLCAALLLAATTLPTHAQQTDADALKLLDSVSAHYRDADYLHLEITTNNVNHGPRRDNSDSGVFSITLAPGERFRYIGEDGSGSSEMVSDGTTEWRFMNSFKQYAEEPVGSFFTSRILYGGDNASLLASRNLRLTLTSLDVGIRAAHFAPDETLQDNGKPILCAVVWFNQDDSTSRPTSDSNWRKTVWIDRASLRVFKVETRSHSHFYFGPVVPPNGPASDSVRTITITQSDFHFEPKQDTFVFTPPPRSDQSRLSPNGANGPLATDYKLA